MMYLKGHKETCEIKPFFWQRISCSWQSAIWVENQDVNLPYLTTPKLSDC